MRSSRERAFQRSPEVRERCEKHKTLDLLIFEEPAKGPVLRRLEVLPAGRPHPRQGPRPDCPGDPELAAPLAPGQGERREGARAIQLRLCGPRADAVAFSVLTIALEVLVRKR